MPLKSVLRTWDGSKKKPSPATPQKFTRGYEGASTATFTDVFAPPTTPTKPSGGCGCKGGSHG